MVLSRRNRKRLESFLSPPLSEAPIFSYKEEINGHLFMGDRWLSVYTHTHTVCVVMTNTATANTVNQSLLSAVLLRSTSRGRSYLHGGDFREKKCGWLASDHRAEPSFGLNDLRRQLCPVWQWAVSSLAAGETRVIGKSLTLINEVALR